jgi:hypothetical protein
LGQKNEKITEFKRKKTPASWQTCVSEGIPPKGTGFLQFQPALIILKAAAVPFFRLWKHSKIDENYGLLRKSTCP